MNNVKFKFVLIAILLIIGVSLLVIEFPRQEEQEEENESEFKGIIGRSYEESEEWWQEVNLEAEGSPNVLLIILDDMGFSSLSSYGGIVPTPNIDSLAENGIRYVNFNVTSMCSPTRASLLAARNPHTIGAGSHSLFAMGFPGYNANTPETMKSFVKHLEKGGFINYGIGKWDHSPLHEVGLTGPFDSWAIGEGFHYFYGYMGADTDNYRPVLIDGNSPVENLAGFFPSDEEGFRNIPVQHDRALWGHENYHLSDHIADKAIRYMSGHISVSNGEPFMMYWAPVTAHSPQQAPQEYIDSFEGQFDMGWDEARRIIFENQKRMGIIPENTLLTERTPEIPAWDSLSEEEQEMHARHMEVYAAMVAHTDDALGRMFDEMKRLGVWDNTIIIFTTDNGSSAEGTPLGSPNESLFANSVPPILENNLERTPEFGGPLQHSMYSAGWAWAGNTPFQYFKQASHWGGIKVPLIIHWPEGIEAKGEMRKQFHYVTDLGPTILDATNIEPKEIIEGVEQAPFDGISMTYTFDNPDEDSRRTKQYFEMLGHRGVYDNGWVAVTLHGGLMPWINGLADFDEDVWELYNTNEDYSQAVNLADRMPEKLQELKDIFDEEAWKYNVYPLYDNALERLSRQQFRRFGGRKEFVYYWPGAVRIPDKVVAPMKGVHHSLTTNISLTGNEEGVIVSHGGYQGGYTMFIQDNRLHYHYNYLNRDFYELESAEILPTGDNIELQFRFTPYDESSVPLSSRLYGGLGELFVNGEKVDEIDMRATQISTFGFTETFDVGIDYGTQVSTAYNSYFPFSGTLDKITINLLN